MRLLFKNDFFNLRIMMHFIRKRLHSIIVRKPKFGKTQQFQTILMGTATIQERPSLARVR